LDASLAENLNDVLKRFNREATWGVCPTGRYHCRYFVWGDGPPLMFVHGLCDDARSFVLPIAHLSQHFRCIAYDLPMGKADGARLSSYQHADLVADMNALADHLHLDHSYLLGSSFGSTIVLAAMHEGPERFPSAVLQGGFARRPLARAEILLARLARYWPWAMHRLPLRIPVLRHSHYAGFAGNSPDVWDFFLRQNGAQTMSTVARRALLLHQVDLREILAGIHQPVLIVCGDCDPLVNKDCERVLLQGLRQATRAELPNCGHLAQFTHAEVLAELTLRFLKPLPCSSDQCAR
jgi:pimeloyl-ACP methyl ester carboxylesterase